MSRAGVLPSTFLREHAPMLGGSLLLHVGLLVLLALNLSFAPQREPQPVRLAIQATVVDARALRQRAAEAERREREARLAAERLRQQAEQQEQDERRRKAESDSRKAEAERQARKEREQREAKAAAETRRKAEVERQARKEREQREAEVAAESRRKAETERRRAQSQAELARQLAEEEDLLAAADSGLLDQYAEVIRQKVERNWIRPASARQGIACVVLVKQIPGGDVVDVKVTECNGDTAVVRSIETAVLRASPLPPPPDPKLFDRSLRFEFRPRD